MRIASSVVVQRITVAKQRLSVDHRGLADGPPLVLKILQGPVEQVQKRQVDPKVHGVQRARENEHRATVWRHQDPVGKERLVE